MKLKDIEYEIYPSFILCSILLRDGTRVKQKYIGYNLCEAKRTFLKYIKTI